MKATTKILVAGDHYMKPDIIRGIIDARLSPSRKDAVEYRSIEFPYPEQPIGLKQQTVIPSGMSWTDFDAVTDDGDIGEYYGRRDALVGELDDTQILVIHGAALPREAIEAAPELRLIVVLRGGPKNIDLDAVHKAGINIVNTPGKTARAVAETTLGGILGLSRNIVDGAGRLRYTDEWFVYYTYEQCGFELAGATIGLVGFGHVAVELLALLSGFGLGGVLVYDPYRSEHDIRDAGAQPVELNQLLEQSDVVSLHARLTSSSRKLISSDEFGKMKRRPIVVNTARGGLLDYRALYEGLRSGRVSGAVLDVFDDQPYENLKAIIGMPNVVATPHLAGGSRETVRRGAEMAAEDIRRHLTGAPYLNKMD